MNGTSFSQTREICLTPPRMTTAVSTVTTAPEMAGSIPNEVRMTSVMAWDCTVQPAPKVASTAKTAKRTASHLMPRPRSIVYMGPPAIEPSLSRTRYLTDSSDSAYLVQMPNTPVIQHQNTAPGPPRATAVETPTILPVPMVAASAVASAPNCEMSPLAPSSALADIRMARNVCRWMNRRRSARNKCV